MPSTEIITIDSRAVPVTHPDKVLFPQDNITKSELAHYYARIAETMLPHVRERPVTMHRFPNGIDHDGFYHKEAPNYFPDWITRTLIPLRGGETQKQIVIVNGADLVYLANQNCIAPHVWLSHRDDLTHPDRLIIDIDPFDESGKYLMEATHALKRVFDSLGIVTFPISTGSRGIHIMAAVEKGPNFDMVRSFAGQIADIVADEHPDRFTTEQRLDKRGERVFLDINRNGYGQTGVAPYAVRALPGAPVAVPLDWSELRGRSFNPKRFTIRNIFRRLSRKRDPLADIDRHGFSLPAAEQRLAEIRAGEVAK